MVVLVVVVVVVMVVVVVVGATVVVAVVTTGAGTEVSIFRIRWLELSTIIRFPALSIAAPDG
jgi:hypothetical protein